MQALAPHISETRRWFLEQEKPEYWPAFRESLRAPAPAVADSILAGTITIKDKA